MTNCEHRPPHDPLPCRRLTPRRRLRPARDDPRRAFLFAMTRWTADQHDAWKAREAARSTAERPAPVTMPEPLERDIQRAILDLLRVHPRVVWAARMNTGMGEYRNADGTTRRVRFAFAGCPDILGQLTDGRVLAIEVKRASGRVTEEQIAFLGRAARHHALAFVARSAGDVVKMLEGDQCAK